MRIAFLNDTSAWYHWGCTATSTAIREMLEARGHTVDAVPIQALHGIKTVPQNLTDFDNPEFFKSFFKHHLPVTKPILESDLVLINGEGSLHHVSKLPLLILYLAYAAKKYGRKHVQIVNHSCYPDGDKTEANSLGATLYRGVYRVLDYVAIREHRSLAVMQQLGVEATLSFDCLPLYLKYHPQPAAERTKTVVVAGSVAWRAQGITALAAYMRAMEKQGYAITVLTGAKSFPARDDALFVEALKKAASEGWTHLDAPSIEAWFTAIGSAALLLSGRFHYTIAACMLDTPAVILDSNTPKNAALAEMAHLPLPQGYAAENLEALLHERTETALGQAPISDATKQEWQARAEKNFSALPA